MEKKSLLPYNTIIAKFLKDRGVEWRQRFSNNLKTVQNVKFWWVNISGRVTLKTLTKQISGITTRFDFVDHVEFRGTFKPPYHPGNPHHLLLYITMIKYLTRCV